jgi:hypothetical protein
MAEELYHAFTIIPGLQYRVMVIAEQTVNEQWIQMSQTELATFPPGIAGPRGCPSDHLRHLPLQLLRTKWCPRHLPQSYPSLPRMRQGP